MSALEWLAMEMVISVLKYKSGRRLFFFKTSSPVIFKLSLLLKAVVSSSQTLRGTCQ